MRSLRRHAPQSFQRRFLGRVLPALIVANVMVTLFYGGWIYQTTRSQILTKHTRLLPALSASLAESLWGLNFEAIQKVLAGVIADTDAVSATVEDDRGYVVASAGDAKAAGSTLLRRPVLHRQGAVAEVAGAVSLRVSLRRARDEAASGLFAGLLTALTSSLVVLAGVFSANRALIVRPLSILLAGIKQTEHEGTRYRLPAVGGGEEFGRVVSTFNAMQDRLEADHQARIELAMRLDVALTNMAQGIMLYAANGELLLFNGRCLELLGLPAGSLSPGLHVQDVVGILAEHGTYPGVKPDKVYQEAMDVVRRRRPTRYTLDLACRRILSVSHEPLPNGGWVVTYEDVTEQRRSDEQIVYLARHDTLTGLPNRFKFNEQLEAAIAHLGRGLPFAVLCLDLDGFKGVNDTLGHAAGDAVLCEVAQRLAACVRETDTVARLGGDEFAILHSGLEQLGQTTALARRIVEALRAPYQVDGHPVTIGVSVGIAIAPEDGTSGNVLLRNADTALYRAKANGRGTWQVFEHGMDAEIQRRHALEADLRGALAQGQFEIYYQPLVLARSQALTGFEALVRWRHPERGLVSPAEFIPLAEETGLIVPLGAWIMLKACTDAVTWPDHVKIAVNLSPVQFIKGELFEDVEYALRTAGLAPDRLELEITESVLLRDSDSTLALLHRLRGLGVRLSMDDFGTGYASLSYLRQFPFDKVKVDQSFVRNLEWDKGSAEIIRAMVGLGKGLGISVLAEGVETEEQLDLLRKEGCDELQGYLFSRPVPLQGTGSIIALQGSPQELLRVVG